MVSFLDVGRTVGASVAAGQFLAVHVNAASYFDQIRASSLIGSHFGYPAISATFDYVVVGGGTAGLTVAYRLAESGTCSVAVIEAGGFVETVMSNLSSVPYYIISEGYNVNNPLSTWLQETAPQPGLGGRTFNYVRGKALGGSSNMNYMYYQRGTVGTYQKWADSTGDSSYLWKNFQKYFKKSITFHPPEEQYVPANTTVLYNAPASGSNGPLEVSYSRYWISVSSWFLDAAKALGFPAATGFLDGKLLGYGYTPHSISKSTQTRSTSETGSLRQALLKSPNLLIYQSTLAKQILFDVNKQATGVMVETGGVSYIINAKEEVIVSAGSFRSPQLLQVSGVGDSALLKSLNIPVISNLPGVGQDVQDNLLLGISYEIDLFTHTALSQSEVYAEAVESYTTDRTGLLTTSIGNAIVFERLKSPQISNATAAALDQTYAADWPTIELLPIDIFYGPPPDPSRNYMSMLSGLLTLFSRGNVTINSTDTSLNPVVHNNYLQDPRDREIAVAALKRSRDLVKAMGSVIIGHEILPGNSVTTDDEILEYIQQSAGLFFHASCGCRMGKADDPMAVLDSKGRVLGVKGLRVVDASSFPWLPPGQPQGTVYGLAEKIAADILTGA